MTREAKFILNQLILDTMKKYYFTEGHSITLACVKTRKELNCSSSIVQSVYYLDENFRSIVQETAKKKHRGIACLAIENHTKNK